jgi:hypothetical protein
MPNLVCVSVSYLDWIGTRCALPMVGCLGVGA